MKLGAVVVGDVVIGRFEGGAQLGRHVIEGRLDLVYGNPDGVDADPVEPFGGGSQAGVTALAHLGQDGPHRGCGRLVVDDDRGREKGVDGARDGAHIDGRQQSLQRARRFARGAIGSMMVPV